MACTNTLFSMDSGQRYVKAPVLNYTPRTVSSDPCDYSNTQPAPKTLPVQPSGVEMNHYNHLQREEVKERRRATAPASAANAMSKTGGEAGPGTRSVPPTSTPIRSTSEPVYMMMKNSPRADMSARATSAPAGLPVSSKIATTLANHFFPGALVSSSTLLVDPTYGVGTATTRPTVDPPRAPASAAKEGRKKVFKNQMK